MDCQTTNFDGGQGRIDSPEIYQNHAPKIMTADNAEIIQHLAGTSELLAVRRHHVIVQLPPNLPTVERGRRLLGLEVVLRQTLDPLAEVFLEPKQDLNKLRQRLRGITVV